jgi:hypothetical protein
MCTREVFKLLKASSFKCVNESSLPLLQVSNEISNLCKKIQVFVGFLIKVLFCDTMIEWEIFEMRSSNINKFST